MPAVLLVRHGQASFGAADYDVLSDLGREQAEVVGRELARRPLRDPQVVAGTLRRQRDTARLALAAAGWDGEVGSDPRFDEYDHVGLIERYGPDERPEDASSAQVQQLLDAALTRWVEDPQGGWRDFSTGAAAAVTDLAERTGRGRDAVVFTSGGVVAAVAAGVLGLGAYGVVALNRVAANAAVTTLVVGSSGTSLVSFNEHAHLSGALLTYR